MKKRKILFLFIFLCAVFIIFTDTTSARAASMKDEMIDEQLNSLGIDEIKEYWTKVAEEYGGFLPESQKGSFMDFVKGEKTFSFKEWAIGILKFLFHELLVHGKLLGTLILLTVFSMMLQSIQNAFEQHNISKVAYAIIYMVIIIFALNSFHVAIDYVKEAIANMMHFMIALMPLLLALMATIGSVASVSFFHPIIVFLVNSSGILINSFVLPLFLLSAILSLVSTLSEHYKVTQLAKLLRTVGMSALGVFFTVFLGVISVQGATTAISDGITIKAAKFVTGNFIPVIGKMFTDAADTVMSASLLLKNTVGVVGVAILLLIALFPAIKVLALGLIYQLAAAILQPLGGGPIIKCLEIIGKSVMFIFAALATVSLMFFLAITVIVASGNLSLMIR
ncbi:MULTISPECIES: stage III sporulation protein AE [Fictibacillus]|uniref:stage III sporulation protein AE n=1 Tax=Fictibacillus TaxID=1329200 RepID=UPI000556D570